MSKIIQNIIDIENDVFKFYGQKIPLIDKFTNAYNEKHRFYHNEDHIFDMLCFVKTTKIDSRLRLLLKLAIIFHDIIYQPTSLKNEINSAEFAKNTLNSLPQKDVKIICDLILSTKNFFEIKKTFIEQILHDADLKILSEDHSIYQKYYQNIEQEYSMIPINIFLEKRKDFLEKIINILIKNNMLYYTLDANYSVKAQNNIELEIKYIHNRINYLKK